jgi:LysM repeat protein
LQKRLLRTRKEYGVSAEELKRANPFLEEEGLQIGQVITIPSKTTTPRIIVKNTPKMQLYRKTHFYHDVLAKETKYSIAKKMELLLRN